MPFYQVLPLGFNMNWDCSALIAVFQADTDIIYLSDIGQILPVHTPILNDANFPSQSLKLRQNEFIFGCSFLFFFLFNKKSQVSVLVLGDIQIQSSGLF